MVETASGRRRALRLAAWLLWGAGTCRTAWATSLPAQRPTSREADLEDFTAVVLQVPAVVRIAVGDRHHIRIEAERTAIDSISFKVVAGSLQVTAHRSFSTTQPVTISIACRGLEALHAGATVDVTLAALKAQRFHLTATDSATVDLGSLNLQALFADLAGSASVTAAGTSRQQKIALSGAASYDASRLTSRQVDVAASGSTDAEIDCSERLDAEVSGAATVRFTGNPKVQAQVTGAATLQRR